MESKKLLKQANTYYSNFHKNVLKDYKEQLMESLNKLAQVGDCTRKDFLDAIHLAEEVHSVVEELEYYYEGSRVPTVQKAIEEVKEVLSLYDEVSQLEEGLGKLSSTITVEDQLRKSSEDSLKQEFEETMGNFQTHLKENGFEISEVTPSFDSKPERVIMPKMKEEQVVEYKTFLQDTMELIRSIKEYTVGEFLDSIQRVLEIESHREELDYLYQTTKNLTVKMNVLEVLDQVESCLLVEPFVTYFDKVSLDTNIGFYIESRNETEKQMLEEELASVYSKIEEKEDDFLELEEEEEVVEEVEEVSNETPDLTPVFERFNEKMAELESETLEEALERLEAEGKIKDVTEEVVSLEEKPVLVEKPRKITIKEKVLSKFRTWHAACQEKKQLVLAKRDYLKEIKKVQAQLNRELSSELTFQFLNHYKENYYPNCLKMIRKELEEKYGKNIIQMVRKDSSILVARKKITRAMKNLSEGLEELLGEVITTIDGTTTRFGDLEDVSEEEFHVMIQTLPVLVGTIEENMSLVLEGKRVKRVEPKVVDLNDIVVEPIVLEESEVVLNDEMEEIFVPSVEVEPVIDVEEVESPVERIPRTVFRNAKTHYHNCKKLLENKEMLLHREDLVGFSKYLRRALESKRSLSIDSSKLWYAYKCSVENLSSIIRKLRHISSVEVDGMIEQICSECQEFVTYFEAYQAYNKKSLREKITAKIEDFKEALLEEEEGFDGYAVPEQGIDQVIYGSLEREKEEEQFDIDISIQDFNSEEIEAKEELQVIPVKPSVRNLEVADAFPELQELNMQKDIRLDTQPVLIFGVRKDNTYMPLFNLGAIEAQIQLLAKQNGNEVEEDVYQKAIS